MASATRCRAAAVDGAPAAAGSVAAAAAPSASRPSAAAGRRPAPAIRADAGRPAGCRRRRPARPARSAGPSSPGPARPAPPPPACRAHTPRRASCRRRPPLRSPAPAPPESPPARRWSTPAGSLAAAAIPAESSPRLSKTRTRLSPGMPSRPVRRCRAMPRPGRRLAAAAEADDHASRGPRAPRGRPAEPATRATGPRTPARAGRPPAARPSPPTRRAPRLPSMARSEASGAMPTSWIEATGTPGAPRRAQPRQRRRPRRIVDDQEARARRAITAPGRLGRSAAPSRRAVSAAAVGASNRDTRRHAEAPARWMRAHQVSEADARAGGDAEGDLGRRSAAAPAGAPTYPEVPRAVDGQATSSRRTVMTRSTSASSVPADSGSDSVRSETNSAFGNMPRR